MAQERTAHQNKIIKNYYRNKDAIMVQKLQELVTDLYLAEGKKRLSVWKRIETALENVGVTRQQIDHLMKQDDPAALAEFIKDFG